MVFLILMCVDGDKARQVAVDEERREEIIKKKNREQNGGQNQVHVSVAGWFPKGGRRWMEAMGTEWEFGIGCVLILGSWVC